MIETVSVENKDKNNLGFTNKIVNREVVEVLGALNS